MTQSDRSAFASVGSLRRCYGPLGAALVQPLITVGMLLFLYAGWHVRDEGAVGAGLRVAFVNTRAYRIDHEHEREAAMLQTELHYAADTDKLIDESLAGLLGYAPLAARVQLGVVHNGVTGVTGVALLRYDVTNSVAAPGKTVGALLLNQPLSDWNNFLPVLLGGRCYLGFIAEQPNPALRARFEGLGAGTVMACPVIDSRNRMLGALFVTWDVRDLPPTGDTLQAVMKHALAVGAQIASALDLRGRLSPYAGGPESQ
jgi:hypothetical protein